MLFNDGGMKTSMSYFMRLDDACERRNIDNWNRMEAILDLYNIKPLVGIIPHCEDPKMDNYDFDSSFWKTVTSWYNKGWAIALHGYNHVCTTKEGGLNPVNKRSEFAGLPFAEQNEKIKKGVEIFRSHGFEPKVFFAPSHTFDDNTIKALMESSNIRTISDTIANSIYSKAGITYVPQQSGRVRKLPFKVVTFCYHPNTMKDKDFIILGNFLKENQEKFEAFKDFTTSRKLNLFDHLLRHIYFSRRM